MVKKSITITHQQDDWLKNQLASGFFGNESEIIRELIRERQQKEQETIAEIAAIRQALIDGEKSGISNKSVDEVWETVRQNRKIKNA